MPSDADHTPIEPTQKSYEDRRSHRRFPVGRPGKLFRRSTQQYAPVTTRNLSFGVALLAVEVERPFMTGEIIDLGISFGPQPVVPAERLIHAIVTRVERLDSGRQNVAVRYLQVAAAAAA
jgi:hypothetical protein